MDFTCVQRGSHNVYWRYDTGVTLSTESPYTCSFDVVFTMLRLKDTKRVFADWGNDHRNTSVANQHAICKAIYMP